MSETPHLCGLDGEWWACLNGRVYGPCEYGESSDDEGGCGGVCEYKHDCDCDCHTKAATPVSALSLAEPKALAAEHGYGS